jgi:ABC-type branched-subunit amino acid transport system substrate-binding protein
LLLAVAGPAVADPLPSPGLSSTEIVVGTHLDLTGPLSGLGTAVRNGIVTAFDEVNATGGIHGRKLRLIALDDDYSGRKAMSATKTLLGRDHIFAMLCPVGTPTVVKTLPMVLNAGVLHLFPFASIDETFIPRQPLEFATDLPVAQQIAVGTRALVAMQGMLKVGVLYRDDALGRAALKGAVDALASRHLRPVASAPFTPGAVNFSAAIETLRAAGAEFVVIGGIVQEAITAVQQAAAQSWFPVFLCGTDCYVPELPMLGGKALSGLYVVATTPIPYPDDSDPARRIWVRRYEQRFGTVASRQAFRAYLDARLFAEALRRAGPAPSPRNVARALETMPPWRDPKFDGVPVSFTPHNHVGFHTGFLAQIRDGRWATLTGPLPPAGGAAR